ncbi:type III effector [Vibrio sp. 10N.286.49.B3]|uniref:HopJ type III effector protein n=1 Tax=Vibrio sp. 10N.286.49.B3 TaxID=1880855 RepID=UPI000C833270|nr:HopJ type III effector protein [Vibrio sp. 10N.286.49.B3]PMH44796.1 type III effector [Vibrio sp. 10N.286.49.B3]
MELKQFLSQLKSQPETIGFNDTMAIIDGYYSFMPTAFINGSVNNEANTNNGSCKIFAFGQLHNLSTDETLACFGDFYRVDVLQNAEGQDHGNIRNFIQSGWSGIKFDSAPLAER